MKLENFASRGDLAKKKIRFDRLGAGLYAFTAEGDPNTGVILGDKGVMVVDAQATPLLARQVLKRIRKVTKQKVRYVVLSHYHAVRTLGASAYRPEEIIASRGTHDLLRERGAADFKSEAQRFPRLFRGIHTVPGLTWPTLVFEKELTVFLGRREVRILHPGKGHTAGDTVVWLPKERVLYSGDLVEFGATPYCGDAHLGEWSRTLNVLRALRPKKLVPGRGRALHTERDCQRALSETQKFIEALQAEVNRGLRRRQPLGQIYAGTIKALKKRYGGWVIFEHCLPFNVSRAYDEARGISHPRVWTAERDLQMWKALRK